MASTTRRDLYLQVSATTDPFTRAMRAASGTFAQFGTDVAGQLQAIKDRFADLGGPSADASAKALQSSFTRTFTAIRAQAEQALTLPTTNAGALNLNLSGAQGAAAAAAEQATALREVADAAARASAAEGDNNAELRVFAASSLAAATSAEEYAAALRTQAATLGAVQGELDAVGATSANVAAESDRLAGAHGRASVSTLILEHSIRSASDSFSAGLPLTTIFAEQVSRLGEAAALMGQDGEAATGVFGRFAAFMGGPWGIAIVAATAVLGPLVSKLFEAHDALQLAKAGNDGLADAQGVLGKMFDLTSGRLEHQNSLLRLNAELTAVNLRAEASKERADSTKTFGSAGSTSLGTKTLDALAILGSGYAGGNGLSVSMAGDVNARAAGALATRARSGQLSPEEALKQADKLDYSGLKITKQQFEQAIVDSTSADLKTQTADKIEKTLDTGVLDPSFRRDTKAKKPRADRTVQNAANDDRAFQNQLRQADDAYAKAMLQLNDTAEQRYDIEVGEIAADLQTKNAAVQDAATAKIASQKLTGSAAAKVQADADTIKAKNTETAAVLDQVAKNKEIAALLDQAYTADQHARAARDALLQVDLDMATTRKQRLAVEQQLLADAQEQRRQDLLHTANDPTKSAKDRAQATTDLAGLPAQNAAQSAALNKRYEDPLSAYRDQLKGAVGDTNDALQGIEVDAFKGLDDAFSSVISGSESVSAAIKKMVTSLLSEFAKLAVEKGILSLLGGIGGGTGGGADGIDKSIDTSVFAADGGLIRAFASGGISGVLRGPGGPREDAILARLSAGEFVVNAASTAKHLPMLHAINDNRLPGFAEGGFIGASLGNLSFRNIRADDEQAMSRPSISIHIEGHTLNAPGADPRQLAQLQAAMEQDRRELPARVIAAVKDAQGRLIIRNAA